MRLEEPVTYETVLYDVTDGVATITLNRPEKLNAMNDQLADDVQSAVREADEAYEPGITLDELEALRGT